MIINLEDTSPFGNKTSVRIEKVVDGMEDLVGLFVSASLALGYHPDTVDRFLRKDE